jgi:hypothetical protein
MYAVSLILDPGCKMSYYQNNKWEKNAVVYAKDALLQTIEAYGGTPSVVAAVPQSNQANSGKGFSTLDEDWDMATKRLCLEKENELDRYLEASTISSHADILEWWKQNAHEYPCLARIARDYLAIPATSAPAERVFSGGADLITKKRGSLSDDRIQAFMCLDSWLVVIFAPPPPCAFGFVPYVLCSLANRFLGISCGHFVDEWRKLLHARRALGEQRPFGHSQ